MAEHEENSCPQGYERIFDSDDCDAANDALGTFASGHSDAGAHVRGDDQTLNSEPCGCYMFSGVYHLNTCPDGVGKASSGTWLYCKRGTSGRRVGNLLVTGIDMFMVGVRALPKTGHV